MIFKFAPLSVWLDKRVMQRLEWYYEVMQDKKPAKYLICKSIHTKLDIKNAKMSELWSEHKNLSKLFKDRHEKIKSKDYVEPLESVDNNYLDLKVQIAKRCLDHCNLCEWNCNVNRNDGKIGVCRLDNITRVSSWFRHFGEETPLVGTNGSGTIFFTGCMFHCVFCQNWEISQYPLAGQEIDGNKLAKIMEELYQQGAHNINFVGGEPTPNIHTIIEGMSKLDVSIPMLWNSDMYATLDAMNLLLDVIDIWLPDFKYGNDSCARRLSNIPNYFSVISRNHKIVHDSKSNMIIRHLVLPNHFDCCTKPVFDYISQNCEDVLVNVMGQYRPDYNVLKNLEQYSDISHPLEPKELQKAFDYAEKCNLVFRPIS